MLKFEKKIRRQKVNFILRTESMVFLIEARCVYFELGTETLNVILQMFNTVYLIRLSCTDVSPASDGDETSL